MSEDYIVNVWDEALKGLDQEFLDEVSSAYFTYYYVVIFQKPDASFGKMFINRRMLREAEQLVEKESSDSTIQYVGFILNSGNQGHLPKVGYITEWETYKLNYWKNPKEDAIYKVDMSAQ